MLLLFSGCAAIMKHHNPHMNNVHCMAHKLALCTSQAAEKIQDLKQHQQILTDLCFTISRYGCYPFVSISICTALIEYVTVQLCPLK